MSAILPDFDSGFELGPDGVRRYHTTCKVLIHSHNSQNVLDVSQDVISISTSKSTKGIGSAAVAVTPNKNYLNLVNANDYINIYFDLGDGNGLTRTFFGLVDRIEENYSVDKLGKPTTTHHIISSDFQKIFEKTHIYFNPHLQGRDDLIGDIFGTSNIGGVALATKGVAVHGSPADIIQNLVVLMLGFGTQFSLPDSYNPSPPFDSRLALLDYIESGLSAGSKKIVFDAGGFEKFLASERAIADAAARPRPGQSDEELIASRNDLMFANLRLKIQGDPTNAANFGPGIVNAIPVKGDTTSSLLTVLNLFDFVELASIDGYTTSLAVWQGTGPISSLLRTYSNEVVNELIFDLRPMTKSEETEDYDTIPDEIGGNVAVKGSNGVTHVPAVVFREYPFSTINEFDGTDVQINIKDENDEVGKLGNIPYGAIFSNRKNEPGRHNVEFPAISYSARVRGKPIEVNNRKLDVAVIREQEIKKSTFGKTDHEHVNLIETTNESTLLGNSKFFMQELQPITTPIQIMRNGLRVRSTPTRFARFGPAIARSLDPPFVKPPAQTQAEIEAAAEKVEEKSDIGKLQAPIQGDGANRTPSLYGYRKVTAKGQEDDNLFKFHNGVDLHGTLGVTEVRAIADGVLVSSAPKGGYRFYSQTIIIKHKGLGPNGVDLYSQYSHLSERLVKQKPRIGTKRPGFTTKDLSPGGKLKEEIIEAGQVIGLVGNEKGTPDNPDGPKSKFDASRAHLHFELLIKAANKIYPAKFGGISDARIKDIENRTGGATVFRPLDTNEKSKTFGQRVLRPEHGVFGDTPHIDPNGVNLDPQFNSVPKKFPFDGDNERSLNPVAFFAANGIDLVQAAITPLAPGDAEVVSDEESDEPEFQEEDTSVGERKDPKPTVKALTVQAATGAEQIDSRLSGIVPFRQLARWSLLQDHWFQHNSEYLSGSVEMRGAPEIRVGYRLDLPDRALSFYVESVNHSWQFPNDMVTILQVTRGQPNEPFPLYIPPVPHKKQGKDGDSRLAKFFVIPDPVAVRRGIALRSSAYETEPASTQPTAAADLENPETYKPEVAIPAEEDALLNSSDVGDNRFIDALLEGLVESLEKVPAQTGVAGTDTTSGLPKK